MEAGRQSRDVGPFLAVPRMDGARPEAALPPVLPEILVNLDVDRDGRVVARPGSHFISRLGVGPIMGMHEHTFERGDYDRKLVAVVADAYSSVTTGYAAADPATGNGVAGFCPSITTNGQSISPINAKPTDRFHFQSFLNRLYFAGSSNTNALYVHDFSTGSTKPIPGVKCRSVVALGNRLYVAGNPSAPNLLYPSNPDEPTTFNPDIALQVGNRTDGIIALREHRGMVIVFGERSCSWVLPGAIELGDVQTDAFTTKHGIVGPLAVDEGGDGWLYWMSREDGLVRWRRGQQSPDAEFAREVQDIVETVVKGTSPADLRGTVVAWDPSHQCVRYEIPGSNLLVSYFPYKNGAWTCGASTSTPEIVANLREYDEWDTALGEPRYTALANRRDPISDNDFIYGGGPEGHIWLWNHGGPDKLRWDSDEEPIIFRSLMRWGNVELAPINYRAVVEEMLIDYVGGYDFEFDVWAEVDYDGFELVQSPSYSTDGGVLPIFLTSDADLEDATRVLSRRLHPMHVRVGNWDVLVGKVFRFQMEWDCLQNQGFIGLELEVSPEAEDQEPIQYPPTVSGRVTFAGYNDGAALFDDPASDPHAPPENPNVPPDATFVAYGSTGRTTTDELAISTFDQEPVLGDNLSRQFWNNSWTAGATVGMGHIIVSSDQTSMWVLPYDDNDDRTLIHYTIDPANPSAAVKDYEYDTMQDALNSGYGANLGTYGIRGAFYLEGSEELWVLLSHRGGDNSKYNTLVVYDVSSPAVKPTGAAFAKNIGTSFQVANLLEFDSRGNLFVGRGGAIEAMVPVRSGGAITDLTSLDVFGGSDQNARYTTRVFGNSYLAVASQGNNVVWVWDISDPSNVTLLDSYDFDTDGLGNEARPCSPSFNADGTRLFVALATSENAAGLPTSGVGFVGFDITDLAGAGLVRVGAFEDLTISSGGEYGWNLHWYGGPANEADVIWCVFGTGEMITVDVSVDGSYTEIDREATGVFQPYSSGMAGGPHTTLFSGGGLSTEPGAVDANLCALLDASGRGVLVGADDTSAPELEAFIHHRDLGGILRGMDFAFDGSHLFLLSGRTAKLWVYATGASFGLVGELEDSQLAGCDGLMVDLDERTLWSLDAANQMVAINISDPTAPVVDSATDAGPSYLGYGTVGTLGGVLPVYASARATLGRREGSYVVATRYGDAFWLNTDPVARNESQRPESQRKLELVDIDATYLYGVNWWYNDRALAVVDHTDSDLPTVGYLSDSRLDDTDALAAGMGVVATLDAGAGKIHLWDVSTPASPAYGSAIDLAGVTSIQISGTTLFVAGSSAVSWDLKKYDVSNPAAPVAGTSLAGTDDLRFLTLLSGGNLVAYDGAEFNVYNTSLVLQGSVAGSTPTQCQPAAVGTNKILFHAAGLLYLLDASTASSPSIGSSYSLGSGRADALGGSITGSIGLAIDRSVAFLGEHSSSQNPGLTFLDCSGSAPVLTTRTMTDAEAEEFGYAPYVAAGVGAKIVVTRDIYGHGCSRLDCTGGVVTLDHTIPVKVDVDFLHPIIDADQGVAHSTLPFRVYRITYGDRGLPRLVLPYGQPEGTVEYDGGSVSALSRDGNVLFVGRDELQRGTKGLNGDLFTEPGVYAYDVSTPSAASRSGRYLTDGPVRCLAVSGDSYVVFAVAGYQTLDPTNATLYIIDFTDTANPVLLGSVDLPLNYFPDMMRLY